MGSKKTTTTSSATPWGPGRPYIEGALSGAKQGYNQASSALTQVSPYLSNALSRVNGMITRPPAYMTAAQKQLTKTINGGFLGKNPYASSLADQIAGRTNNQYITTFGGAGRAGSGLAALLSSQGVGDALNSFYSNQYATDRGYQQNAILNAPAWQAQSLAPYNELASLAATAVGLPQQVSGNYASQVNGLTSPYATQTNTQKSGGGLGSILGPALAIAGNFIAPGIGGMIGGAIGGGLGGGIGGGAGLSGLLSSGGIGGASGNGLSLGLI